VPNDKQIPRLDRNDKLDGGSGTHLVAGASGGKRTLPGVVLNQERDSDLKGFDLTANLLSSILFVSEDGANQFHSCRPVRTSSEDRGKDQTQKSSHGCPKD
jgi:hypothetical protein